MKRICSLALSAFMIMSMAGSACAEGFALSDWGARGTALGGGMVGRANDASAVAYNPAGITQLEGVRFMAGSTVITPMGTVKTVNPLTGAERTTDVERNWWINPHAFFTYQYNDDVWFGMGLFSRFGLGNSYPSEWAGRTNLVDVKLQTITLNPNIAYKVNDSLSLAIGLDIMGASMLMHKDTQLGASLYNRQKLDGLGISLGVNLAAHYVFNEEWAAGLTYRSRVRQKVSGESSWDRQVGGPMRDSDLHGTLNLPDVFSFGVTYKPIPTLSFEAGTVYTVWSNYRSLNIHLEDPANFTAYSPKNWHDTWAFNLSAEYQALDWLTLRAGYIYETSPMDDATKDYMTPSEGRHRFSTGAGFAWDEWTVDVAYSYILINTINYDTANVRGSGVMKGTGHDGNAHVMAVSVGYKF